MELYQEPRSGINALYYENSDILRLSNHERNLVRRAEIFATKMYEFYAKDFGLNLKELDVRFYTFNNWMNPYGFHQQNSETILLSFGLPAMLAFADRFWREVIPHEVAHAIQKGIYPESPVHGDEFLEVMKYMNNPLLVSFELSVEDIEAITPKLYKGAIA